MLAEDRRDELAARIAERAFGLGPLEPLLADPAVDEIMVSGRRPVWVERGGRLEATGVRFEREADLRDAIERILAPLGRRADEAEPLCDARLPGRLARQRGAAAAGAGRAGADHPPLPPPRVRAGGPGGERDADPAAARVPRPRRARARTVLVCGGTGSGKTTTLNALSSFIGEGERVVTIEDAAELRLRQPHVVRLEARPPNLEGRGEVTIRRLVRNALRMRPDRIIVGEVRGAEALDMLTALSTGHDGSLCTVHAGSPAEALRRVEVLALMADLGLPHAAIREQVADAFDLVVCQARTRRRRAPRRLRRRGRPRRRRRRPPASSTPGATARAAGAPPSATPSPPGWRPRHDPRASS